MIAKYVLASSIILQLIAAILSLRLIRLTGKRIAWILISGALVLMSVRRIISLYAVLTVASSNPINLEAEVVACIISILMVLGMAGIAPVFYAIKNANNTLKDSERFIKNIFDSIQDGISVLDTDMRILKVNAVMEKWYAHAMPLIGKKCYEAYHGRREP